jgi:transglutaminase-like putative cysteine protease
MPKYTITHITRYTYPSPVIDSINQIILFPVNDAKQEVIKHELTINNDPYIEKFNDYFGNQIGIFSIIKPHTELLIRSVMEVNTVSVEFPQVAYANSEQWKQLNIIRDEFPYMDFLQTIPGKAETNIHAAVKSLFTENTTPFELAVRMSTYVYDHFEYKKGITNVETKVDEIWEIKAGVCQDFAHVLLVMLRYTGIPARYVSGYICPKDYEQRGEGATHAWVEAYIPGLDWIGLDPTNNCIVTDGHVRLAVGRSFLDCTPVKGTYKGSSEHTLEVSVVIEGDLPALRSSESASTSFTYQSHQPASTADNNSYRKFIEMQQQQ